MEKKLDIINLDGYLYAVDKKANILYPDWFINCMFDDNFKLEQCEDIDYANFHPRPALAQYKVIVSNSLSLTDIPQLPSVKRDIEQLASKWSLDNADETMATNSALNKGFIAGYKAAQSKQFTAEDIKNAMYEMSGYDIRRLNNEEINNIVNKYLQSLQPVPKAVVLEMTTYCDGTTMQEDMNCPCHEMDGNSCIYGKPKVDSNGFVIVRRWVW
jgi:hypothetical protein